MTSMKTRMLSPLYLASLCFMIPLLWLSNSGARRQAAIAARRPRKRNWQLLRVLARDGAESLGMTLPLCMLVAALAAGFLYGAVASWLGALLGFVAVSLVPVLMPAPSSRL